MEDKQDSSSEKSGQWECAICFEELRIEQSCLTSCGHLYCWPCLHQWMETFNDKTSPPVCPVCKNVLTNEKIIPIFGRGNSNNDNDPRMARNFVPRPVPQRDEAPQQQRNFFGGIPGMQQGNLFGVNFSAGLFGPGIMAFGGNLGPLPELTPQQRQQQQFMSQIMLFIGIAVLSAVFFT